MSAISISAQLPTLKWVIARAQAHCSLLPTYKEMPWQLTYHITLPSRSLVCVQGNTMTTGYECWIAIYILLYTLYILATMYRRINPGAMPILNLNSGGLAFLSLFFEVVL